MSKLYKSIFNVNGCSVVKQEQTDTTVTITVRLTPFLRSKCPLSSPKSGAGRGLLCPEKLPIQHSGIHFLSE